MNRLRRVPVSVELTSAFVGYRLPAELANVIEDLVPQALHNTVKYADNRVDCDHTRLNARLRPMHALKTDRKARAVIAGHAHIQNLRRGDYEVGVDARAEHFRCVAAFDELASMIRQSNQRTRLQRDT